MATENNIVVVKPKRNRNTNFTQKEIEILLIEVKTHFKILNSSFNSEVNKRKKQDLWRKVVDAVNSGLLLFLLT